MKNLLISSEELTRHRKSSINSMDNLFLDNLLALQEHQLETWALYRENIARLNEVETKEYPFDQLRVVVQHNPARIISTSASVDTESIKNRPCFLCANSLPSDQKGLLIKEKYLVLCNPFSIFHNHFTLPDISHRPQNIDNRIEDMLMLAKEFREGYAVLYNGPGCGASAPDHFHFQAVRQNSLPIITALLQNKIAPLETINERTTTIESFTIKTLRFVKISTSKASDLVDQWNVFFDSVRQVANNNPEPLVNLILFFHDSHYHLLIYPREKHRPKEYYYDGESKLVISPAAVDLGGIVIIPRKEDFEKINFNLINEVYDQVLLSQEKINRVINLSAS